ncbi:MAG: type II CAAX endopeptidase family protein [Cytophagales bacterium]|nr:type II CAAX endopeptidase family protein [Cytophagales bacterium]
MGNEVWQLGTIMDNPTAYPNAQPILLFAQGFTSFFAMILVPALFIHQYKTIVVPIFKNIPNEIFIFSAGLLVVVSMPLNAWIADVNMTMNLPEWMQVFESWAQDKEEQLKVLTEFLTNFDGNAQFGIGLIVIALIPAIGEELVFRGVILTCLVNSMQRRHSAIWLTAIIFSAIHMQFYGFVPRMLLGAMFGYLYLWSQNLIPPIFAHFVNNGFTLYLIHLKNQDKLKMDIETSKDMPWYVIAFSAVSVIIIMLYYKNQIDKPFYKKLS